MTITVTTLELGCVELPDWHPRSADRTSLIQGYAIDHPDGVIVFDTGHTPGHQSLLVQSDGVKTLIGGECCSTCAEFGRDGPVPEDVHDETWMATARDSITRLRSFAPDVVHLSHDRTVLRRHP